MSNDVIIAPMMHQVPALIVPASEHIIPPTRGLATVGVGASSVPGSIPALIITLTTAEGETVGGIIPANHANDFEDLVKRAMQQIRTGTFEGPGGCIGAVQ